MRFGSLFSGIGGIDLGLERAGMECAFQVENEPYCLKVLAKHWPNVTRYEDIREVDFGRVERVDLLAGGFPCQDLSYAGKGAGLSGERSGLWGEFVRAIRMVRPRYVLIENVPGLLGRGMGVVLGDLSALGYDAEWESIPAAAFGAPHLRWRVFIVAHRNSERPQRCSVSNIERQEVSDFTRSGQDVAYPEQIGRRGLPDSTGRNNAHGQEAGWEEGAGWSEQCGEDVAHSSILSEREPADETDAIAESRQAWSLTGSYGEPLPDANGTGRQQQRRAVSIFTQHATPERCSWWEVEPGVGRVASRISSRLDGGLNAHEECIEKARAKGIPQTASVRELWEREKHSETSSEYQRCLICGVSLSELPCEGRDGPWYVGSWAEEVEDVHRMRQDLYEVYAHSREDLRQGVSLGDWTPQCEQTLAERVNRLRGLGNAVVPQKAEWLGRLILQHEAA